MRWIQIVAKKQRKWNNKSCRNGPRQWVNKGSTHGVLSMGKTSVALWKGFTKQRKIEQHANLEMSNWLNNIRKTNLSDHSKPHGEYPLLPLYLVRGKRKQYVVNSWVKSLFECQKKFPPHKKSDSSLIKYPS